MCCVCLRNKYAEFHVYKDSNMLVCGFLMCCFFGNYHVDNRGEFINLYHFQDMVYANDSFHTQKAEHI